jgi:nitrogen-specific signal transduction histidine kinase
MCDPVTMAVLTVGSAAMKYQSDEQMGKAQRAAADNAMANSSRQLNRRATEEAIAAGDANADVLKDSLKRQGEVRVQAAEGGIEGLSVQALMNEVKMDEGGVVSRNEQSFQNTIGGLNDQMAGARGLQEQRYMNSSTGDLAELGMEIVGAGATYNKNS